MQSIHYLAPFILLVIQVAIIQPSTGNEKACELPIYSCLQFLWYDSTQVRQCADGTLTSRYYRDSAVCAAGTENLYGEDGNSCTECETYATFEFTSYTSANSACSGDGSLTAYKGLATGFCDDACNGGSVYGDWCSYSGVFSECDGDTLTVRYYSADDCSGSADKTTVFTVGACVLNKGVYMKLTSLKCDAQQTVAPTPAPSTTTAPTTTAPTTSAPTADAGISTSKSNASNKVLSFAWLALVIGVLQY